MTKLRSLVEGTNIGLLLVSHLRRPSGDRGHEDGKEVSLSHLRGSASIAHLSDSVIALERNQQADDPVEANTTTLRILKNRYTGETGISSRLHYNKESGRMTEINNPFMENEEDGDSSS
jgi:twinkle protein